MALIDTTNLISITEANKLGISGLVREAEEGHERVVLRNNKPVAAVVSMERIEQLQQIQEDVLDIALASARMMTAASTRHSLDDILARFGYTREQLRDLPEE